MRFYSDPELLNLVAQISLPHRSPYTIDGTLLQDSRAYAVKVYNENHQSVTLFTAHSHAAVNGLVFSEPVFSEETSNRLSFSLFPAVECTSEANCKEVEDANPRYIYTEGGTRFQIYHGKDSTNRYFGITSAMMYTLGPDADAQGYFGVPQRVTGGGYRLFIGGNSANSLISLPISDWDDGLASVAPYVAFATNIYRYANEDEAQQVVVAKLVAYNIANQQYQFTNNDARAYTVNVFDGTGAAEPEYAPTANNARGGGSGTGNYAHGVPEGYDWSTYINTLNSALNDTLGNGSSGLSYYVMKPSTFSRCLGFAYSNDDSLVAGWKADIKIDAFIAAYKIPHAFGSDVTQQIDFNLAGEVDENVFIFADGEGLLKNRIVGHEIGTISLENSGWDDFNDFTNTRATLFLPFVGRINIDINAIARGQIRLNYMIDATNGNISYFVYTKGMEDDDWILYGIYSGNCALQMPTSGTYQGNILQKIVNAGTSIATGNVPGVINAAIELNSSTVVNRGGGVDPNSGAIAGLEPRLDIQVRQMKRAESEREVSGLPGYITKQLRTLSGFVQVVDADMSGLTCSEQEQQEIYSLLRSGIYI